VNFPPIQPGNPRIALVEDAHEISYGDLAGLVERCSAGLLGGKADLDEERIAFFIAGSVDYVTVMHGVWRAGGIAVPLNAASTIPELEHYLSCARATRLIADPAHHGFLRELCERLGVALLTVDEVMAPAPAQLPTIDPARRAMMIFTSGTTNKPKGVISTHANVASQVTTLLAAWGWSANDTIPLFLPLHHIHGIINVLSCALWAGARVHLFEKLDISTLGPEIASGTYSVFMAAPTVYVKLIQYLETAGADEAAAVCRGFGAMRLNVSGSAACPVPLFERWRELTGQVLLERYGMTEIGMALSNPYRGERRAGSVGTPLPGVDVRLAADDGSTITDEDHPGEIQVRGPNVFLEYWDNPKATAESFTEGWFRTGDMAVLEHGYYRIMGRTSIDIIKSGGYKISALEIEGVLLEHPGIAEVAVIGAEDPVWGEAVAAFVVCRSGVQLEADALRQWCRGRLSDYKIPKQVRFVDALPRNAMGKVTKPDLKPLLAP
jgi:malonyl-CoA/methylmalonyl-CoA synthetase